jgi:hypothetical protein
MSVHLPLGFRLRFTAFNELVDASPIIATPYAGTAMILVRRLSGGSHRL